MALKKRGLGRNLEALLSDIKHTTVATHELKLEGDLRQLPLAQILAGKYQPRQDFDPAALEELAHSIRAQGIIQPIVVRSKGPENYEIIAGERRFRAAKMAGLTTIPALIRELPDEATVAVALIENIQREELHPIEEAQAFQRLIQEFNLTHEQVANAVGRSRTAVTNVLRLLTLPDAIKHMLARKQLEMGHARALLSLSVHDQVKLATQIIEQGLSVRQIEALVRKEPGLANKPKLPAKISPEMQTLQHELSQRLGLTIRIQQNAKGRGKLLIKYRSAKELEKIVTYLQ